MHGNVPLPKLSQGHLRILECPVILCLFLKNTMKTTHRFQTFKETLNFLMSEFQMTNQQATHFIWDNQFTMGTDRAIWITEPN
jgi:hypothetical protein